jgi:hypothetical protein
MDAPTSVSVHDVLARQYRAVLAMLEQAIMQCPDALWLDPAYPNRFWHLAYHALFYTHLYLQESEAEFHPWPKHRLNYQFLGATPWPPHERPKIDEPFSREEVLEYLEFCRAEIEARVSSVDLDAASGFYWLPFKKLELQLYNIRHTQHHTAQLLDRLRTAANLGVAWVSFV